jgi:DNA-directed RNA polymerase subunit beta
VRTIAELAAEEFRKGFLKLRRTAQERMNLEPPETATPRSLINSKTISSAIDYFFGRSELSQVVDQTNPLAQLTHERRLSALGPGGLNRKRAGFEVRDVHISHYGRICPIETPEGTNIGLIASLSIYGGLDQYGFLVTPYQVVRKGRLTDEVKMLRADEEADAVIAPADTLTDDKGRIVDERVLVRKLGEFAYVTADEVQYRDISPQQIVGVSASLIPFLEHDDANRALMGSNMQRQAVPHVRTEAPLVGTGMEGPVARNSGMVVKSDVDGAVTYVDAQKIKVGETEHRLRKFVGLNEKTCLNQKPVVREGDVVRRGHVIADGAATCQGELALGKNVLVGFMVWDGYNFEDAIIVSERLVKQDTYTSIHVNEFDIEIRETKLGREEFTRDIPNVGERALKNLDETGVVKTGTKVKPGDILVGKVSPKSKSELTPEEKLLHAIFGRAGEDVKNDSLEVPSGVEGVVIDAQKFSRNIDTSEEQSAKNLLRIRRAEKQFLSLFRAELVKLVDDLEAVTKTEVKDPQTGKRAAIEEEAAFPELRRLLDVARTHVLDRIDEPAGPAAYKLFKEASDRIDSAENEKNKLVNKLSRGDELPTGVLEMVKVYLATKRSLSVGDKMAGRHGNKGVIAKILPVEDMPFLEDGTPVDILLNPLGVPSRMNVGQILETILGWAARTHGFRAVSPVFNGAQESEIRTLLRAAGLPEDGKVSLFDGRTGEPFDQKVTCGHIYMLKLHHLVDDKVHARATGPYSLITQQPLGGKARFGGQRFGEMEVWALEAYGAANILQELLTVKSDDVEGRTKIYEAMVKGTNILEPGTPVSFEVLTNEIRGLALNMELHRRKVS